MEKNFTVDQPPRFKTHFNMRTAENRKDKEYNYQPSLTVPDQTLSIREIMDKYRRGIPLPAGKEPVYDGEDAPFNEDDLKKMDISERQELLEQSKIDVQELQEKAQRENKEAQEKKRKGFSEQEIPYEDLPEKGDPQKYPKKTAPPERGRGGSPTQDGDQNRPNREESTNTP